MNEILVIETKTRFYVAKPEIALLISISFQHKVSWFHKFWHDRYRVHIRRSLASAQSGRRIRDVIYFEFCGMEPLAHTNQGFIGWCWESLAKYFRISSKLPKITVFTPFQPGLAIPNGVNDPLIAICGKERKHFSTGFHHLSGVAWKQQQMLAAPNQLYAISLMSFFLQNTNRPVKMFPFRDARRTNKQQTFIFVLKCNDSPAPWL